MEPGDASAIALHDVQVTSHDFLEGTRILLVEDNLFNQQVASELLAQAGALVTLASNGFEALECLKAQTVDCVLMDIQMPMMDGFETTRHIRANPDWATLPVIAMTANARSEDRQNCIRVGMNDFIAKPVQPVLMFDTLGRWLKHGIIESNAVTSATTVALIDLSQLEAMWQKKPEKVRKYALMFEQTLQQDMTEIASALAFGDVKKLGQLGHRIKSSAATIGAERFAGLCYQLEKFRNGGDIRQAVKLVEQMQALLPEISRQIKAVLEERYGEV